MRTSQVGRGEPGPLPSLGRAGGVAVGNFGPQLPVYSILKDGTMLSLFWVSFPSADGSSGIRNYWIFCFYVGPLGDMKLPWVKWEDTARDCVVKVQVLGWQMRAVGTITEEVSAKSLSKHLLGSFAWYLEQSGLQGRN